MSKTGAIALKELRRRLDGITDDPDKEIVLRADLVRALVTDAEVLDDPDTRTPLVNQLTTEDIDAARIGQAIADLLNLPQNDYPGDVLRFDTIFGDKTLEGLARTIARVFDDEEFRVNCNEEWEEKVGVRTTRPSLR